MAKVLTGISGNLISAASAAFAPTNSADVSAIASAYQVVSATATQLYAGSAYVTSVNSAPLSASRAGNAANASLANSAWYDGTGRLISALPDSAVVSAIASAYAESAASGKQDELTFSYDDDKISAINGSALAGQGGGGEQVVTSLQYAVSEATSTYELYQPAGTTGSDMSSNLLAINDPEYGMGQYDMSGLSSFDVFMTGMDANFESYSATMSAIIVKASASGRQPWEWSPSDTAFGGFLVSVQTGRIGYDDIGSARVSAVGLQNRGSSWPDGTPFYIQPPLIFFTNRANPVYNGTARIGTAYGSASYVNTAAGGKSSVSGVNELPIYVEKDTSVSAIAETYAQSAVSSVSGNYYPRYLNPSNFVQSGNVVMRSSIGSSDNFITSINGTPLMATDSALIKRVNDTASAAAYQTAFVDFDSGSVSRSVFVNLPGYRPTFITAFNSYGGSIEIGAIDPTLDPDNYAYTGQYVVTSTAAVSARITTNYDFSASAICGYTVPLAHASALPTYSYDAEDKISAINGSAIAGGGAGGVDSATVSAIASSYAESAVPSYQPLSGMSGYASAFSAGEGLEFVQSGSDQVLQVEAPVDIVAGAGIVIDNPDGNTLRVSVDQAIEVTLYEDSTGSTSVTLSESYYNFERVRFTYLFVTNLFECTVPTQSTISSLWLGNTMYRSGDGNPLQILGIPVSITNNGLTASTNTGRVWWFPVNTGSTATAPKLTKVVGIHRIANN